MTTKRSKIGVYLRVSTRDKQSTRMQKSAILNQWVKPNHVRQQDIKWYSEKQSGRSAANRPVLQSLLRAIDQNKIDTLVVYKLDRLARNTRDGLQILASMGSKGIRTVSVSENIDFSNATGILIASVLLSVAQFSREQIVERIRDGMQAAREAGTHIGRPRDERRLRRIRKMFDDDGMKATEIAAKLKCTRSNVYASLAKTA